MKREDKEKKVAEIKGHLESSNAVIVIEYKNLSVDELTTLRRRLKAGDTDLMVTKCTLARLALSEIGEKRELESLIDGQIAMAFVKGDAIEACKLIIDEAAEQKNIIVKGAVLENRLIESSDVKKVANLPSKEVLVSQVIGAMQAPVCGLVNVLSGNIRNLVIVLNEISKNKAA